MFLSFIPTVIVSAQTIIQDYSTILYRNKTKNSPRHDSFFQQIFIKALCWALELKQGRCRAVPLEFLGLRNPPWITTHHNHVCPWWAPKKGVPWATGLLCGTTGAYITHSRKISMKMFFISFLTLAIERVTLPALKGGSQESSAKAEPSGFPPPCRSLPNMFLRSTQWCAGNVFTNLLSRKGRKSPNLHVWQFLWFKFSHLHQSTNVMSLHTKLGRNEQ